MEFFNFPARRLKLLLVLGKLIPQDGKPRPVQIAHPHPYRKGRYRDE